MQTARFALLPPLCPESPLPLWRLVDESGRIRMQLSDPAHLPAALETLLLLPDVLALAQTPGFYGNIQDAACDILADFHSVV